MGDSAAPPSAMRRIAGAAGLGYVAGVGIENMEILAAPTLGSSIADIRSTYEDQAFNVVTSFAGAIALLFYCVFVAAIFGLLRAAERRGEPWAVVALVGGVGGPVIAGMGLAANAVLVRNGGTGLSDDVTRALFDVYLTARMVGGIFIAVFLLGTGIAALRSGALPRWLAWLACAIGVPIALAPLAALTSDHAPQVAVSILFGFDTLWIFMTSLWLVLANGVPAATFARRAAFLVLVLAAGLVGIGLLAAPGATGQFFAWELEPEPLAAFAGGVYLGSAAVYAIVLPRPWRQSRGFVVGAVVLSVSVLTVTFAHLDIFDFDRLQAWAWVVLFAGFALVTVGILVTSHGADSGEAEAPLAPWARALLAGVAVLLGVLAVALWVDPTGLAGPSPFALPPLGGRFAGAWIALLAVLTGWGALANRRDEARLAGLALVSLPAGALVAAVRTISDLESAGAGAAYIVALTLLVTAGLAVVGSTRPSRLGSPAEKEIALGTQ